MGQRRRTSQPQAGILGKAPTWVMAGLADRLNDALELRSAKCYGKAKEILLGLANAHPNSASVFALLSAEYARLLRELITRQK